MIALAALALATATVCPVERASYALRSNPKVTVHFERAPVNEDWQQGVVVAGTLDRSEELECRAHIFTAYKQGWVDVPDDVPHWPEMAPAGEFIAIMARATP